MLMFDKLSNANNCVGVYTKVIKKQGNNFTQSVSAKEVRVGDFLLDKNLKFVKVDTIINFKDKTYFYSQGGILKKTIFSVNHFKNFDVLQIGKEIKISLQNRKIKLISFKDESGKEIECQVLFK